MGGLLNNLTSPFGVKLFPGGPYPDAGAGDKMQQNLQQYMTQLAPLIAAIAGNAGVVNPLTGQTSGPPMAGGSTAGDPYALSALDQANVNRQAGTDTQTYDKILKSVKADLAARGMADSSTMGAAEAYLKSQLAGQLGSERLQAGENAFQNRNQAMQQIAQLLSGQYGAQQNVANTQGEIGMQKQAASMSQLGSLLGLFFSPGGLFNKTKSQQPVNPGGVGTPPFNPNPTPITPQLPFTPDRPNPALSFPSIYKGPQ